MESTRFIYLSMAMFTRTDAMFHSRYLKQNKKTDYVKNINFFSRWKIWYFSGSFQGNYCKVLVSSLVRITYTINALTIVFQIINIDGERLEVVIPISFSKFAILCTYYNVNLRLNIPTIFPIILPIQYTLITTRY